MSDAENKLREVAQDLLSTGRAELVLGYENGSLPMTTRPCFVRSAEDVQRLVWNEFCTNNLAVYLPGLFARPANLRGEWVPPKVAIIVKGCDARSVVGHIKENQVDRERLTVIGVPCEGMADPEKAAAGAGGNALADVCLACTNPTPEVADIMIEVKARPAAGDDRLAKIREFEAKSPAERWAYFTEEVSKCIRCYACRQACPNCYCKVCFIDQGKPRWAGAGSDISDTIFFHIGRIFHQAGRCVECDACVRACPMGIDLRMFTVKLGEDVKDLFDYVPGLSVDEPPPLCAVDRDEENLNTEL